MSSVVFHDAQNCAPLKNYLNNAGYYLYRTQDQGQDETGYPRGIKSALFSARDKQGRFVRLSAVLYKTQTGM